jgi:CDP-diacylglycerol--glycerol-3-phosphate 3-phosphatidyltransferase
LNNSVHTVQKSEVSAALFTWSNFISFSRILIVFPIIYLHHKNGLQSIWAIGALVLYGVLSDYLDGYVARKTHSISEWGKILDPVADKTAALLLFVYAVWIGLIPLWFLIIEAVRDLFILGGSLYIQQRHGKVAMAVMSGKWSVNALSAYWICAFFVPAMAAPQLFFMGCALTLMALSFIDYIFRFRQIERGMEFS